MLKSKFIRTGYFSGKQCTFTHWYPATNRYRTDDLMGFDKHYGVWIPGDSIRWS